MNYLALRRDLLTREEVSIDRSRCLHHEAHAVVQTWLQTLLSIIGEVIARWNADWQLQGT
jgi:hypothetical protein